MPWIELKISSTVCRRSRVVSDRYLSLDSTATAPDWPAATRSTVMVTSWLKSPVKRTVTVLR